MRDCDIQLINLKSLEFMICILQFTSTNHEILLFFADLKNVYICALLCLQINIHKTMEEKKMVTQST